MAKQVSAVPKAPSGRFRAGHPKRVSKPVFLVRREKERGTFFCESTLLVTTKERTTDASVKVFLVNSLCLGERKRVRIKRDSIVVNYLYTASITS